MIHFLGKYKKIFGILGLLLVVCGFTAVMAPDSFLRAANIENTVRWTALFGIISVGVSFVIMTGGIDLSIGSVVGLIGCILAMSLNTVYQPIDLLVVRSVDPSLSTIIVEDRNDDDLTVGEDASMYRPGDTLSFLEKIYTVVSSDERRIVVDGQVSTGESVGSLFRVIRVVSLTDELPERVRRGSIDMALRTIVLQGIYPSIRPSDKLKLIQDVGLPQEFSVHSVEVVGDTTEVNFFVRPGQRVRPQDFASFASRSQRMPTTLAIAAALAVALLIGLVHGLLITKVKLQPFVVTLCGLLIYRGLARYLTSDQEQGFGTEYPVLKEFAKGDFLQLVTGREFAFDIPMPFIYMLILAVLAAVFLNKTIFGRYVLALGRNENAARYSGINTERTVIIAYMICSFCAGLAAILFALDLNSIQPSGHGEFYELYAIAAAVLGGCSLRGGEGSILGVVIAAAVMRVLNNAINLIDGIDTSTEFAIIGLVILLGVVVDETVRRLAARRRASSL